MSSSDSNSKDTNFSSTLYQEVIEPTVSRTIGFTFFTTTYGLSRAYYRAEKLALPFYIYAGTGVVVGSLYFGSVYGLKNFRKQDDFVNYAVPGAIHGSVLTLLLTRGLKKSLIAGVVGGFLGSSYYYTSNWLYDHSRASYIAYRKKINTESRHKKLVVVKPTFPKEPDYTVDFGNIFTNQNVVSKGNPMDEKDRTHSNDSSSQKN